MVASWACEVTEIHTQKLKKSLLCDDYSDLTCPTSNHVQLQDICIAVSVAYDYLKRILFTHVS